MVPCSAGHPQHGAEHASPCTLLEHWQCKLHLERFVSAGKEASEREICF